MRESVPQEEHGCLGMEGTGRWSNGMITCRPTDVEPPSTLELCCLGLSAPVSKMGRPSSPVHGKKSQ